MFLMFDDKSRRLVYNKYRYDNITTNTKLLELKESVTTRKHSLQTHYF